jgi:taurine dioxygenase
VPERRFGPRPWVRAERERLAALRWRRIEVSPLGATLGAEIGGVDLGRLDDETFAEIARAFLAHKVIFFRDQPIGSEEQLAFARRFGELEEHPFLPAKPGYEKIVRFAKDAEVKGVENVWHSDVTWREVPSLGSVLRAVEVPRVGGDTLFADMHAAWDGLDPALKQRLAGLFAVHDFMHTFGLAMTPAQREEQRRRHPEARHPVARTHPQTGRKAIYVNAIFTRCIEGLPAAESDALLDHLYRQADVPEYQCRFRWAPGSVAFWDNRAVQHYAASD